MHKHTQTYMYIHVHTRTHTCIHTCIHILCTYTRTRRHAHARTQTHRHTDTRHTQTQRHKDTETQRHRDTQTHRRIDAQTHRHTHTHTHMHARTHRPNFNAHVHKVGAGGRVHWYMYRGAHRITSSTSLQNRICFAIAEKLSSLYMVGKAWTCFHPTRKTCLLCQRFLGGSDLRADSAGLPAVPE